MRSPFMIPAVALAAALCAGTAVRADLPGTDKSCEVVVYVGSDTADLDAVRSWCAVETGKVSPDAEEEIASADGTRGRILVYKQRAWTTLLGRRSALRLRGKRWISDVFVNGYAKPHGAPSTIAVVDGDLEPRVVRDQPAMTQVGLPQAALRGTGAGVVVAVLDGGFDLRHECLQGRLHPAALDALDQDGDPQDLGNGVDDDDDGTVDSVVGHGTFTASLILAAAPDATILPIRVLDDEMWGTPLSVAQGIQHAIDHGADVINMSLVVPTTTEMVRDAVRAAIDAGIVVVSSAGNGGSATWQNDPQLASKVITVGAVDGEDRKADFSTTGAFVHVYAPGVRIVGALGGRNANDYAHWDGTSFSAPIVSGVAAIGRGVKPGLTSGAFREALMGTSEEAAGVTPSVRGRVDAASALAAALR